MEDEGVGSDDERPPTRAAPAESPARESLRPASKKKKLNQLDEGEEFEVTVTLDESVYGAGSVSSTLASRCPLAAGLCEIGDEEKGRLAKLWAKILKNRPTRGGR